MTQPGLLALVAARGGSKGLPRKNARALADLPLIGWTAAAIRDAGVEATAILSTDDEELASIGRSVGLEVPFVRPAELATDTATAVDVALHALDWYQRTHGRSFFAVAWLQPTSPFRRPSVLADAWRLLEADAAPCVVGVKAMHRSLATLFVADASMRLQPISGDVAPTRRQDVRPLYTPNGALYMSTVNALQQTRSLFPTGSIGIAMDQIESLDIDDATDWSLAEAVAAAGLSWRGSPRR